MKNHYILSVLNILMLCIAILAISSYFIYHSYFIGPIMCILGFLCLVSLIPFKIKIQSIWADIVFGMIDNGILAVMAIFGGEIGGTMGAIIGGVIGNAITDGIAGIFEGLIAEKERMLRISDKRTMLGSAVGKMSGCLLGAGFVLTISSLLGV